MANIDDKKNNFEDMSNMFDDDLFGSSSNDLFGSTDDLFNNSSDSLFAEQSRTETSGEKKDNKDVNSQTDERSLTENIENEEGHYDDNGYYWFNNGTYYDNKGLYHDLDGNVLDEDGNIVENNMPVEKEDDITEKELQEELNDINENLSEEEQNLERKNVTKKERKKLSLKIKLIICAIVLVILLAGGITGGILYYNKISVKLETPVVKIEKMYNKVILEATEVEKAIGYEFVVSIDDANPVILKSNTNKKELDVTNYKKIVVKARCLGKVSKANSNYSVEQTLSNKLKLKMNTVYIDGLTEIKDDEKVVSYKTDAITTDDTISWESVKNASKYYVYYKVDIDKDEVKKYEVEQGDGTITFNLSKLYQENGAGSYNISVVAIPENNEYYELSDYSETKIVEYFTQQEKIIFAEKTDNVLSIYTDLLFNASKLSLSFNYGIMNGVIEHQLIVEDLVKEEVIYSGTSALKFTVDISEFVRDDIENISIIVLGDGKYSTNSESYVLE